MRKWFLRRRIERIAYVLQAIFTTRDLPTVSIKQAGQKKK